MARSRNIKPGFFTNEDLVELDFATRLLFAGLWTVADRDGRLQDRPKKIKIDVFPADNLDIDAMLSALHNAKFITRYEVDGAKFIQIHNWTKHQNPHHTEKASDIPDANGCLTVKAPLEPKESPKQDGECLADSLLLIPDSLIPDSLKKQDKPATAAPSFVLPDWIPSETWKAYCQVRTGKKAKNEPHALGLIVKDLERFKAVGHDPIECLNNSIKSGWAGVFEPKPKQQQFQVIQSVTTPSKPGIDPTLAGLIKESISGAVKPPSDEIRNRMKQLSGVR